MQDLRSVCESLGWQKVRTHLQSGNVVFETRRTQHATLAKQLTNALEKHKKLHLAVLIRTAADLCAVATTHPFALRRPACGPQPPRRRLPRPPPTPAARDTLLANVKGREELHFHRRELYIHYRDGIARSKLTNTTIEKTLATPATARNWNTVTNLTQLANTAPDS